jgi:hypothetical protein
MDGNIAPGRARPTDTWSAEQEALRSLGAEHKTGTAEAREDGIGRITLTQADIFYDFMRAVREDAIKDENGNTKYNEYSDARSVAETMGAKVVARVDDWNNWLFPDGSTIEILNDGSGINKAPP